MAKQSWEVTRTRLVEVEFDPVKGVICLLEEHLPVAGKTDLKTREG